MKKKLLMDIHLGIIHTTNWVEVRVNEDKKLEFGSTQDRINHKMLEEFKALAKDQADNTTIKNEELFEIMELDLMLTLNDRVNQLTNTVEDLVKMVEANHKGLKLLTNIVSANEIALTHLEKVIKVMW